MPRRLPADRKELTCRLPTDLYDRLLKLATRDMRNLNTEIVWLLTEAVRQREQGQPPGVSSE